MGNSYIITTKRIKENKMMVYITDSKNKARLTEYEIDCNLFSDPKNIIGRIKEAIDNFLACGGSIATYPW